MKMQLSSLKKLEAKGFEEFIEKKIIKKKNYPGCFRNECTKVQNPRYKDFTLNKRIHLSINKTSLKSIIVEQFVGVLSSSARIRVSSELVNLRMKLHR